MVTFDGNRVGRGLWLCENNANDRLFSRFPKLVFSAKKSLDSTLVLVF